MDHISQKLSEKVLSFIKAKDRDFVLEQISDWSPAMWFTARFTAQAHGIAPYLYVLFKDLQVLDNLDQNFHRYIKDQYFQNHKRISRIQEILQTLLSKANDQNIPIMPLKGSILISDYYSDPAIRPMADIDLLISPKDKNRLAHLLESMDYHPLVSYDHKVYTNVNNLVSLDGEHPDNPIKIEYNHMIGWPIGHLEFDITNLIWDKAKNGFLGFESVFSPAQERLLLMLICHNAGNQFNGKMRAFQLHDLSLVTRQMDHQQWSALQTIVKEYQLERLMFSVLTIAKRFADIEIPDGLIEEQKWCTPRKLQHHVETQSADSLIASNDYKLLNLKLKELSSNINHKNLKVYQLLFTSIVQSMQLKWFFSGKEKILQIRHHFSLSTYQKGKEGNKLAYISYYWFILPIVYLPMLIIGNRQRNKLLGSIRLKLLRYLFETQQSV
jgi:hypothetical protein